MKLIQPIVEGHGEKEALPVLLRRLCNEASAWAVEIGSPIRRPRNKLASEHGVMQAVAIARRQPACEAILIAFDGDRDCPAELGPKVRGWAAAAAGDLPCEVVLPHREYEAWFLAAIESLRTHDLIRTNAESHPNPEQPHGCPQCCLRSVRRREVTAFTETRRRNRELHEHGCRDKVAAAARRAPEPVAGSRVLGALAGAGTYIGIRSGAGAETQANTGVTNG